MSLSLSNRCLQIAPSVTFAIDSRAKALRAKGVDVVGFGVGEPDFDTPEYIRKAAQRAMDEGKTHYTPVAGTLELREQVVRKLKEDNGLDYTPEQIIVSNGAKQSLFMALCAMINPGDEVLIPAPCWVSYPEMVRMAGGVPVMVMGREEDSFVVTAEMLAPHVTMRTKALILNTPNNPNGCVYPKEVLRGIAELAVERGFYVISDEIYEKLIYDGEEHVSIASFSDAIKEQTLVVNGVSKTYAMTGWRIGYAAGPKALVKAMSAFQGHATSGANSIAQAAAAEALRNGRAEIASMVAEFGHRRDLITRLINEIDGVSTKKPQGAFYVMMNISQLIGKRCGGVVIDGSETFAGLLLDQAHVAVVPAKAFGSDVHVRLSYAVSREQIEKGIARIGEFVRSLSKEAVA
ncbi:MAG: pyridoxal phosphate-dependent aminotransferase [Eubacteriales bacterium]|nr:pyridoxal phosphate-dependent aminotransferase [Eubacteriales bacterium]